MRPKRWHLDREHENARSTTAGRTSRKEVVAAMSMLTFYINRAGKGLGGSQRRVLEGAKGELRKMFGRDGRHARSGRSRR